MPLCLIWTSVLTGTCSTTGILDLPSCPTNLIVLSPPTLYTSTDQSLWYLVRLFTQCWSLCWFLSFCNLMRQHKLKLPVIFPDALTTALLETNCNRIVSIDGIGGISVNFPEAISLCRYCVAFLINSVINVRTEQYKSYSPSVFRHSCVHPLLCRMNEQMCWT